MANSIPRYLAHSILRAVATFCEVSLVVALQLASYGLELRAGFVSPLPLRTLFRQLERRASMTNAELVPTAGGAPSFGSAADG